MEFAIPASATMTENGIRQLEKVHSECLRRIIGVKEHSSGDALEVIGIILPVRIHLQELCTREFLRTTRKPGDSKLYCLLATATICRNQFTPMSYLKYTARSFQRSLGNLEVEKEQGITAAQILEDINVKLMLIPMAADLGGAQTRTMDQIQEGKNQVNSFVQAHRDSSVMVFSDGAVEADGLAMGSCAAVLLPTGALSNNRSIQCFV